MPRLHTEVPYDCRVGKVYGYGEKFKLTCNHANRIVGNKQNSTLRRGMPRLYGEEREIGSCSVTHINKMIFIGEFDPNLF